MVVLNMFAGLIAVLAAAFSVFTVAVLPVSGTSSASENLPLAFAVWLVALDLALRVFSWSGIIKRAAQPTLVTREGYVPPARRPAQEFLEAMFGPAHGGQLFFVIPVWIAGTALGTGLIISARW